MGDIDCGDCDCGDCDCGDCDCGDCDCGDCDCCGECGCCGDDHGCCSGDGGCCGCGHCYCPFFCPAPDLTDHHGHDHGGGSNPFWTWIYCDGCCDNSSSSRRRRQDGGRYVAGTLPQNGQFTPNMATNGDPTQPTAPGGPADVITTQPPPSYEDAVGGDVITTQPNTQVPPLGD